MIASRRLRGWKPIRSKMWQAACQKARHTAAPEAGTACMQPVGSAQHARRWLSQHI